VGENGLIDVFIVEHDPEYFPRIDVEVLEPEESNLEETIRRV
jgi:hypothetical protein